VPSHHDVTRPQVCGYDGMHLESGRGQPARGGPSSLRAGRVLTSRRQRRTRHGPGRIIYIFGTRMQNAAAVSVTETHRTNDISRKPTHD
jgi:hypothetical protein